MVQEQDGAPGGPAGQEGGGVGAPLMDDRGAKAEVTARTSDITQPPPTEETSAMAGVNRLKAMEIVNIEEMMSVFRGYRKRTFPGEVFRDSFFATYYQLADMLTSDLGIQNLQTMLDSSSVRQDLERLKATGYDVSYVEGRLIGGHTLEDIVQEIDCLIGFINACKQVMEQEHFSVDNATMALEVLQICKDSIQDRIRPRAPTSNS